MPIGASFSPTRSYPITSTVVFDTVSPVTKALSTGGGAQTMTVTEILSGLLTPDTQDAQTWNTPTAALLNAAIPGIGVGVSFEFTVINYGDSTLTIGLGTGVTKVTIATVSSVLTIATLTCKRFRMVCTGVLKQGSASDSWNIYTVGASAAAVA